jgi:phosphohistidine phosphatase
MLRLFLVRHAKAQPPTGGDDFERMLADRGRADAGRIAVALLARGMLPDLLIHSGAARAKETAEILAAEWSGKVELQEERGLYNASQASLLTRARALTDSAVRVGFVGHNPGLGELAVSLAGSGQRGELRRMAAKFPTCGVAALNFSVRHWGKIKPGSARLSLFLTPSELKADKG